MSLSESSIEMASASIPTNLTTTESKIDLPHQTTTDQGLHNSILYVNIYINIYCEPKFSKTWEYNRKYT